jgi:hypothetical protein
MLLLIGTDNDYSVTQTGQGEQYDVWISGTGANRSYLYTPLDDTSVSYDNLDTLVDLGALPDGYSQVPGYLFAFKLSAEEVAALNLQQQFFIPEPAAALCMGLALPALLRRRSGR